MAACAPSCGRHFFFFANLILVWYSMIQYYSCWTFWYTMSIPSIHYVDVLGFIRKWTKTRIFDIFANSQKSRSTYLDLWAPNWIAHLFPPKISEPGISAMLWRIVNILFSKIKNYKPSYEKNSRIPDRSGLPYPSLLLHVVDANVLNLR